MVVLLHLAVAREGIGRHLGQTELAPSYRLLALLTLSRPLAVVDREPVVSHRSVPKRPSDEISDNQLSSFDFFWPLPALVYSEFLIKLKRQAWTRKLQQFTFHLLTHNVIRCVSS